MNSNAIIRDDNVLLWVERVGSGKERAYQRGFTVDDGVEVCVAKVFLFMCRMIYTEQDITMIVKIMAPYRSKFNKKDESCRLIYV